MATSEAKELAINTLLSEVDDAMEDGPADDEPTDRFLLNLKRAASKLSDAIDDLTVTDADEIWAENVGDEESEEV